MSKISEGIIWFDHYSSPLKKNCWLFSAYRNISCTWIFHAMHGFWLMYTIFICFCTFYIIPIANSSFTGLWGCLSKPVCVCLWVTDSPVSIILYYTDKFMFLPDSFITSKAFVNKHFFFLSYWIFLLHKRSTMWLGDRQPAPQSITCCLWLETRIMSRAGTQTQVFQCRIHATHMVF